ncbi:MAG: glycosyltransferase family 39 protein [Firmicutes bacterium]|nr:glycosyltransferase family 39 protein [Bacillota bacterium]
MEFRAILNDKYDLEDEERKKFTLKPWHKTVIYFLVIAAVVNILAVIYITRSNIIYFWDNATYWDISRKIASGALGEGGFWRNVYQSVGTEDYNYIAGLPSAAVAALFGESRLAYVLGLVNMYLIPSYILIYLLAKKVSKAPKIAAAVTILLCPVMLCITLLGFADIGGILICLLCFNLYYTKKGQKDGIWRYALIGALLVLSMLWRRWYAFFAVSFITAMLADCVLFRKKWYKPACAIAVAALLLVVLFRDFLIYRLMNDYGSLYAGYKFSVGTDFKLITRYFGLIFVGALAVCSIVAGVKKKENRTVFMWVQIIVCLFMFLSTQTHGQQHLLLYVPSLIMLTLIIIKHITKEWMLIGISALALVHSVSVYLPRTQPTNVQEIKHMALIPNFSLLPVSRGDTDEILALKQKLDTVVYAGDNMGVLASSFTLNEDIMKNVEPSLGESAIRDNYIVSLPQVDSRDKDLSALYTVNYVLVAIPAQTHLAEGSQTVVTEAVRSFEEYTDIATAYEEITDCETVIGDMTIKLFHRVREENAWDIDAFESRLYK